MSGALRMTKDEMAKGFAAGRQLTQEEWAHPQEKEWIDELSKEGKCIVTPWEYKDNFQCEVRYAKGTGNV